MDLSVLIFAIVIVLFVRFAVAVLKSSRSSSSTEQATRVRQAIQAMGTRRASPPTGPPLPPPVAYQPPAPAPPDVDDAVPTGGVLNGPQLVDLTPDQQRRVLAFMEQGYEVMAVRLVCDETRAGILDAQKTVRTLAGLPSPY